MSMMKWIFVFILLPSLSCAFAFQPTKLLIPIPQLPIHGSTIPFYYCPTALFSSISDDGDMSINDKDNDNNDVSSDLSWMERAMGTTDRNDESDDNNNDKSTAIIPPGLIGFAVHPKLGFVALIAASDDDHRSDADNEANCDSVTASKNKRIGYVIISPKDTEYVRSAEGLTLVQLVGGLDLGLAILPPDKLMNIFFDGDDDNTDDNIGGSSLSSSSSSSPSSSSPRMGLRLERLEIIQPSLVASTTDPSTTGDNSNGNPGVGLDSTVKNEASDSESKIRDSNILLNAPAVFSAVQSMPDHALSALSGVDLDDIISAMGTHANGNGKLTNPKSFRDLLDTLRDDERSGGRNNSKVRSSFRLTASVPIDGDDEWRDTITVEIKDAFVAIAISIRYGVTVEASTGFLDGVTTVTIKEEGRENEYLDASNLDLFFPAFRPLKQLYEDAKVMDGFVPGMFLRAKEDTNIG